MLWSPNHLHGNLHWSNFNKSVSCLYWGPQIWTQQSRWISKRLRKGEGSPAQPAGNVLHNDQLAMFFLMQPGASSGIDKGLALGQWTQNLTALTFLPMKMCEMPTRRLLLKIPNADNLWEGILKNMHYKEPCMNLENREIIWKIILKYDQVWPDFENCSIKTCSLGS